MKAPIKDFDIRQHPDGDVTQYFGENVPLYMQMGLNGHNGIDIVAPHGTPMYAVESGTICDVKDKPDGYGKHVRFMTDGRSCRVWTYGHCEKIYVKEGQRIEEGDHIADMGNTGFVVSGATPFWATNPYAGTHLHIGYRNCTRDSRGWAYLGLPEVKIKVQDYDNGFKGNVDPYDMLEEVSRESEKRRLLTIISLLNKVVALYKQLNLLK
jgi:murein DD-endopeptidase MepM/ murein hydrolase activator NlpD